ncbi:MAG: beta-L-arabinofuranosidase domain-containing protein [Anaerolineae bacterium]
MAYGLRPVAFRPLALGRVRPLGWLERQLRIQADGLSGHLDEFWPDVRDSRWFGGDTEAWERAPYWLDGLIPLAFVLDDATLKDKATRYVDYILTHQHEDGWLGPRQMVVAAGRPEDARYDLWAQLLAMKVLVQYHDATGDGRAVEAVEKCLRRLDRHIDTAPLFNWGQFRWFEGLIAIFWLYEKTGGGAVGDRPQQWLLDLAVKLHAQGFDWRSFFARWPLAAPTPKHRWNYMGHVVNNAMAIKAPALWQRLTGDNADRAAVYDMIEKLDRYHGMVTGVFTGDECLAGRQPTHGTELCAVVEYAYSLEVLLSVLGDPAFGDRLEKIVFNALPATFSPDMWAHQYDQQVNQVECSVVENRIWNTNGPASNIFGVEPNYGCCTANLSQGWPKFAANLWMQSPDGGLTAVAYAPSRVETAIDGVPVTVMLETAYPFRSTLRFTVNVERPVTFPLWLRIPAWTTDATVRIADGPIERPAAGTFYRIAHEWRGTTEVTLTLPMTPALWRGYNDAVALTRGPLVYALKIGEDWRRIHENEPYRDLPHADWEVYPTRPWNYALAVDEATLFEDVTFTELPVGEMPFSPQGAPVEATVKGRRLPEWGMDHGSAADALRSPVTSSEPLETLTLIPYGCTNLRITEFPVLAK